MKLEYIVLEKDKLFETSQKVLWSTKILEQEFQEAELHGCYFVLVRHKKTKMWLGVRVDKVNEPYMEQALERIFS